jgi:hypothetical protein
MLGAAAFRYVARKMAVSAETSQPGMHFIEGRNFRLSFANLPAGIGYPLGTAAAEATGEQGNSNQKCGCRFGNCIESQPSETKSTNISRIDRCHRARITTCHR